jgi:two-component system NtrC family response regulator/two-component system nitrogen regulation response regulator GlnG
LKHIGRLASPKASRAEFFHIMSNSSQKRFVLVVDDELLIRWSLCEALTAVGYGVAEASDAAEARGAFSNDAARPDVVLLDFRLPDSDDLGLLTAIRQAAPSVPVVLMTAHGTPDLARGALALGAFRVVSKPFEVHDMVALVGEALAAR